ncbi:hypothetical protein JL720_13898 [Aureococcus anophagefferens]|nr:hypothetical protein JL720_13898 [Aureococcus anophagefferens]
MDADGALCAFWAFDGAGAAPPTRPRPRRRPARRPGDADAVSHGLGGFSRASSRRRVQLPRAGSAATTRRARRRRRGARPRAGRRAGHRAARPQVPAYFGGVAEPAPCNGNPNRTRDEPAAGPVNGAILARVNALDVALYAFAERVFDAKFAACFPAGS